MKKIYLISVIALIVILSYISALTTTQIFFDDLETANFATIWTNDANNEFSRSTGVVYAGTYAILADGGTQGATLTLTNSLNVSNQTSCNLSSVIQIHSNLDGGEFICMDYSLDGGTTWNRNTGTDGVVGGLCQDGNVDTESFWRNVNTNINYVNETSGFKVRFRISSNNNNEDAYVDDINLTCERNEPPTINNITASHDVIKGGNTLTIYANSSEHGVLDTENQTLYFYCDSTNTPTAANTDCTGGITTDTTAPYTFTCTFPTAITNTNYTEYCRVYDGYWYSSVVSINYTTDSNAPTTSIVSVAGDTSPSYYDNVNDGRTDILVNGEVSMSCRWSSSDVAYSSMSNACTISGIQANCSVNDVVSQGFITRYVSCQDNLTNEQNATTNLNVQFYLDYTAPTTSDNSVSTVQVPTYVVTITEADNVDADPTSFYCTSTSQGCNPTTSIDNGGTISYTSANRGINYLRYYSVDDAGNSQVVVNKTININRLPVFTSATDNAVIIKGGNQVNVSSISYDLDSGQELTMYVCNSQSISSGGCGGTHYCNSTGGGNMSCVFNSEIDSATHTWYAYLYDELNEMAVANFSGSYTTDSTSPGITIVSPLNITYTQTSITFTITVNEVLTNAWYNLNYGSNITMTNTTTLVYTASNNSIGVGGYLVTFYANDSYGNLGNSSVSFSINTAVPDTTPPTITILSPINNSYDVDGNVLLNISSDEDLRWAGYTLNGGSLTDLDNVSTTNWNSTLSLTEGSYNITFYANDTSDNSANSSTNIYVDLTNPRVLDFQCSPNPANDSQNINCSANVSDSIGLNYFIIGFNATGTWQNSSQGTLIGTDSIASYVIASGNSSPGQFQAEIYLYDDSGRLNNSEYALVNISDDTFPLFYNLTYQPNTSGALDPGVTINVNVSIVEDYSLADVFLMYMNISSGTWNLVNMSNLTAIVANTPIIYNASFIPGNGTWYIQINATDSAGNQNISSNLSFVVIEDTSQNITTDIPVIKSILFSDRADNTSLGGINLTNTGDDNLSFNITLSSDSLNGRLFVNDTFFANVNYTSVASGDSVNLTIFANTTGLSVGFYNYTLTILSEVGIVSYSKQINVQSVAGPILDVLIDTYSSTVTRGQTDLELVASVTNLGTSEATDVYLVWTLPSEFSVTSGNLTRYFSNIPVGLSSTNTIVLDVSSTINQSAVNITASASSSNADSDSQTKAVTITNPITVTETIVVTTPPSGGGGGGLATGGGGGEIVYSKEIEIVRGESDFFKVDVENRMYNSSLQDLTLTLTGFSESNFSIDKYFSISPKIIKLIPPRSKTYFTVELTAPSYKGFEENTIKAVINGFINTNGKLTSYTEKQNILLIIQEINFTAANLSLSQAEKAIAEMISRGYNVEKVNQLFSEASSLLSLRRNKDAYDLTEEILVIKKKSFEVNSLINLIEEAIINPKKMNLLSGNSIKDLEYKGKKISLRTILSGRAIFGGDSAQDILDIARAAFLRGDYDLAEERAKSAQVLLILERKGNFGLFIYLYWHLILASMFILSIFGILIYRKYQKVSVSSKIRDLNKEEANILKLNIENQKKYFSGKISSNDYEKLEETNNKRMAKIEKLRIELRNRRIKTLKPRDVLLELNSEKIQIENLIKKIQFAFYKNKKIGEKEYKMQFNSLNSRLAEIERDRTTLYLMEKQVELKKDSVKENVEKTKDLLSKPKKSFIDRIKNFFSSRKVEKDKKGIVLIDDHLMKILKEKTSGKNCKGKWIELKRRKK